MNKNQLITVIAGVLFLMSSSGSWAQQANAVQPSSEEVGNATAGDAAAAVAEPESVVPPAVNETEGNLEGNLEGNQEIVNDEGYGADDAEYYGSEVVPEGNEVIPEGNLVIPEDNEVVSESNEVVPEGADDAVPGMGNDEESANAQLPVNAEK